MAVVLLATLPGGDPAVPETTPLTCLVCGSYGLVDVWRNVALFVPLGLGLALLGLRPRAVAAAAFLLSLSVETLQLAVIPGRDASLSDLVTNTGGALLATLAVARWRDWLRPSPARAATLARLAGIGWAALLTATGVGLRWAEPPDPYRMGDLAPFAGELRPFEGTVHEATLNGAPATPGRTEAPPLLPAGPADTLRIAAHVEPSYPPGMLRPLVWLHARDGAAIVVFGQRHRHLVLRLRTASRAARLASPTYALADAFPEGGGAVRVSAEVTRTAVTLRAEGAGFRRVARFARSPASAWMLLVPWSTRFVRVGEVLSWIWAAALLVPLGYWASAATMRARARHAVATVGAAAAVLVPWGIAAALGLAAPAAAEVASAVAGFAAGWLAWRVAWGTAVPRLPATTVPVQIGRDARR